MKLIVDKKSELLRLAKLRQETRWFGYKSIADYHGGVYECDFVSPYTKSGGNVDAEIMVLLQDWTSDDSMSCPRLGEECRCDPDSITLGYSRHVETNIN